MITTIEFEDHGQDFLEFDIDEVGNIVASRPFQQWHWNQYMVANEDELYVGGSVHLLTPINEFMTLIYPIKSITEGKPCTPTKN